MAHKSRFHLAVAALFLALSMFSSLASACTYSLNPTSKNHTSAAGTGSFELVATPSGAFDFCFGSSTPVSNNSWITITSSPIVIGGGTVNYSISANGILARTGTISIAGKTFTVTQNGTGIIVIDPCLLSTHSFSPTSRTFDSNGGDGTVTLTSTPAGCPWTLSYDSSSAGWIYDVSPTSGTGTTTINYRAKGNQGVFPGSSTMQVGGATFTVNVSGCTFSLSSSGSSVGAAAGSGSFTVSPNGWACAWVASSDSPWLTIGSGSSGSGGGSVNYNFAANGGTARTGTISVTLQTATLTFAVTQAAGAALPNYSDSWWNSSESGWGITITDHGSNAFVQWYTYDGTGHNQKFVISGGTFSADKCIFNGNVTHATGPAWTAPVFDPLLVVRNTVGTASIDFCPSGLPAGTAVFSYSVSGVIGSKQLTRLSFGNDVPHYGGMANTGGPDYTDLWWNPAESGWGVSVTQHGNNVFFRIFVYDTDGRPLLFVVPGVTFDGSNSFTGALQLTSGPYFGTVPFDPAQVVRTTAGSATMTFTDANNGVLTYTVNGVTKSKAVTRLVF